MRSPRLLLLLTSAALAVSVACAPAAAPTPTQPPAKPAAQPTTAPAAPAQPTAAPAAKPTTAPAAQPTAAPAAQPTAAPAAKPAQAAKLKLGAGAPDFTETNLHYFMDQMRSRGVAEMDLTSFQGANLVYAAMVSGSIDVAQSVPVPLINLYRAEDPKLAVVAASLQTTDYLLVARTEIKSLKDLEGKRVGISTPGDISDTLAKIALKRSGVDITKVDFVQIGGTGARMSGLLAEKIDAGMAHVAEGLAAIEKSDGKLHNVLTMAEVLPGYMAQVFVIPTKMIKENRPLAQSLVDGWIDSIRWAATNKEGYIALAKKNIEKPPPDQLMSNAYDILIKGKVFGVNGGMTAESLKQFVDTEKETGNLKDPIPAIERWSDLTLMEDYLKRKGRV